MPFRPCGDECDYSCITPANAGGHLYLACLDPATGQRITEVRPCKLCTRMIINAGLKDVIADGPEGGVVRYLVEDWVKQDRGEWTPDNMVGY